MTNTRTIRHLRRWLTTGTGLLALAAGNVSALTITVDYQYDTNNFFNTQVKRDALEAAADRYSRIITTELIATTLVDDSVDQRIGFTHPGTGAGFQISAAASQASDALAGFDVADEYRGPWNLGAGEWVLYAGGRALGSAGVGGTSTGLNFGSVFSNPDSAQNRGFRASGSRDNLPVWGGAISFDSAATAWHFDHTTAAPLGDVDFYSIALHEIGHALGLSSTSWLEWSTQQNGAVFEGANAVAAYNADNGAALTGLNGVSAADGHWEDGTYDAQIFAPASPNYTGTVGAGALQDLLMEPIANFSTTTRRLELTNVDVAALEDIGWSVVAIPLPAAWPLMLAGLAVIGGSTKRRRAMH